MTEDKKPRFDTVRRTQPIMHLSDKSQFKPLTKKQAVFYNDYGRLPTKEEELEMSIRTTNNLTPTNITHLEKFKEFLEKNILNEGQIVMISLQAVNDTVKEEFGRDECMGSISMRHIIRKCEEYITHIDALLLGK